jgi:predicted MFS family arabinose efflux permease
MPFIILAMFGLYTMEFGVVGALPTIVARFNVTLGEAGALLGVFAFTVACCGPVVVLYTSSFTRRALLAVPLLVFSASSAASAFAPHLDVLMVLRIVSGVFHPLFYTTALSAAVALYPPEKSASAVSKAVFGSNLGLVIGVPIMAWISTNIGYEASFLFCSATTFIAFVGLLFAPLPQSDADRATIGAQLSVLRMPALWMNLVTAVLILTALFCAYSYAASYFETHALIPLQSVGMVLTVFGVGGVCGNLVIGRFLDRHLLVSAIIQPASIMLIYVVLVWIPGGSLSSTLFVALIWGAVHTSGLVFAQIWVRSVSGSAPAFVTSLFITAANIGVMLGASLGGTAAGHFGLNGAIYTGLATAAAALAVAAVKSSIYGRHATKEEAAKARAASASGMETCAEA